MEPPDFVPDFSTLPDAPEGEQPLDEAILAGQGLRAEGYMPILSIDFSLAAGFQVWQWLGQQKSAEMPEYVHAMWEYLALQLAAWRAMGFHPEIEGDDDAE